MGEERTLTTEYTNTAIDVNISADQPAIPQFIIDRLSRVFLTVMQEEYMQKNEKTK